MERNIEGMALKILTKSSKTKKMVFVDGKKVQWLTLERMPNNVFQVRYQLTTHDKNKPEEVKTEYYMTAFGKKTPKGRKELVELVQKVEPPDADWMWKRQVKRGVIV